MSSLSAHCPLPLWLGALPWSGGVLNLSPKRELNTPWETQRDNLRYGRALPPALFGQLSHVSNVLKCGVDDAVLQS